MAQREMNFEESLINLEKIVKELENGNVELDEAIKKYTEAMNLVSTCNNKLNNAVEVVNKIMTENGSLEEFNIN